MKLEQGKKSADKYVWGCYVKECTLYQNRRSLRVLSFFEPFGSDLKIIIRVLIRYALQQ
jgi:hypothetical protein